MDATSIFVSLIVGLLGSAYFAFGKRSGRWIPLGSGLGLMVVPTLITGVAATLIVTCLIAAVPFVVRE